MKLGFPKGNVLITTLAAYVQHALTEHNWLLSTITAPDDEYLHLQHQYDETRPNWLLRTYVREHRNDSLGTGITEPILKRLKANAATFHAEPGIAFLAHAPLTPSLIFITSLDTIEAEAQTAQTWATPRKQDAGYYLKYSRLARPALLENPRVAAFEFRGTFNHTPLP